MRPFHIVEGEEFLELMKEVAPVYKVPSSTHFKKLLCDKYDVMKREWSVKISKANDLCMTIDVWTETMNEKSFLGITTHFIEQASITNLNIATRELNTNHTAEYISNVFSDILNDWRIPLTKITCTVTDNKANMVAAIRQTLGESKHLPCFAHTINLIVQSSVNIASIQALISKVRNIVKWVKNSVINSDKLRKLQIEAGVPEGSTKKFIIDIKTRWNSLYYMLEHFLDMFKLASALTLDSTDSPEMLTGQEIEAIKKIVQLLKPFEFVTKEASGQNYVTLSKIIPMVSCLISEVRKFSTSIECVIQLQSKLMAECNKRFGLIEYNTYAAFGTILDPRFKNLHFQDANACGRAIQKLKSIIEVDVSTSSEEEDVAKDDFDFCSPSVKEKKGLQKVTKCPYIYPAQYLA
ncbi:zinc finger BED domain-containing protein 4-like [Rhagoletis pomonella]|uniref:zinc finger BED domain-containing protein 4-like n=1 Tax=Rhagoletis pomonella TaxID=28610 RepID=UPI00177EA5F1|nr:zinc finger BED domain-containing protein 4-like [Rhagoletis pomonella]